MTIRFLQNACLISGIIIFSISNVFAATPITEEVTDSATRTSLSFQPCVLNFSDANSSLISSLQALSGVTLATNKFEYLVYLSCEVFAATVRKTQNQDLLTYFNNEKAVYVGFGKITSQFSSISEDFSTLKTQEAWNNFFTKNLNAYLPKLLTALDVPQKTQEIINPLVTLSSPLIADAAYEVYVEMPAIKAGCSSCWSNVLSCFKKKSK